jgi:hypothetical protein
VKKGEKFARKVVYYTNLYKTGSVHPVLVDKYHYDQSTQKATTETVEEYCKVTGSSLELRKILSRKRQWYVFVVSFQDESLVFHKQEFDIIL